MMRFIKIISGLSSLLLITLSIFAILVSSIGIMFTYISLPFALLAKRVASTKFIKAYWLLFLLPHLVLFWRIESDMAGSNRETVQLPINDALFKKCSDELFYTVTEFQKILNPEQKKTFAECMAKEY